jgi:pentatricopeptide repeat protein
MALALLAVLVSSCLWDGACRVFDGMTKRDMVAWTTVIAGISVLGAWASLLCNFREPGS